MKPERRSALVFLACWAAVWLAQVLPVRVIADDALDPSWSRAMGTFLARGLHIGEDYVFTYGPLGYFATNVYEPALFWHKLLLWEIGWRLAASWFLARALWRIPAWAERAPALLLLLVMPLVFDAFAFATIVAVAAELGGGARAGRAARVAGFLVLGALALVKFTFAVAAGGVVLALVACAWRQAGRKAALADAGLALGSGLACWFAAGQGLANLLPWARSSIAIASAYNEGQSKPAGALALATGLGTLACTWALVAAWSLARPRELARVALGLALVAASFFAFKAGYVRGDDHTTYYLGFALVAGWLVPRTALAAARTRAALLAIRALAAALALLGIFTAPELEGAPPARLLRDFVARLPLSARDLCAPFSARENLERASAERLKRFDLARIRERVGHDAIDVVSFRQGVALLNGLDYRPRPVFQSYVAFTPWLQELDVRFYEDPRAPRWVLYRLETIDDRLPTMENARLQETLLRLYRPVLVEHRELLLERRATPLPPARRTLELERELAFGEELALPADAAEARLLVLDVRTRALGRLAQFLYRAPELQLELKDEFGNVQRGRIVPGMMRTGVLIDPPIAGHDAWVQFLVGARLPRARSLRLVPLAGWEWMFESTVGVRIERAEGFAPPKDDALAREIRAFVFERMPDGLQAARPTRRIEFGGRDALFVNAPSALSWTLPAGRHSLAAIFGLVEDPTRAPCSRRACFRVGLVDGGRQKLLFERWLDLDKPEDRAALQVDLAFEAAAECQLVLATAVADGNGVANAWCWWSDVRFDAK